MDIINPPSGLTIGHRGPKLEDGPLPALFYFALSEIESLSLDPFSQPIEFLQDAPIRSFSFSLPSHGKGKDPLKAMPSWAQELGTNPQFLQNFLDQCSENIAFLIKENLVDKDQIAAAGISRGGFIALHLAALNPEIKTVLGFAPLINLADLEEFSELPESTLKSISLEGTMDHLIQKNVRIYVGNRDVRIKTDSCYQFIRNLTEKSFQSGVRSPHAELILYPSIGHKGHGTPTGIFKAGVEWVKKTIFSSL